MRRAVPLLFSTVLAMGLNACSDLPDTGIVNDEDPLTSENGLTSNALTSNALTSNALTSNALTSNALTSNALTSNALVMNALRNQNATGATARMLFRYLVSCALPAGKSVTYTWTDVDGIKRTETNPGGLGIAPGWETSTPSQADKEYVSACLAARVNSKGTAVPLSLRAKNVAALTATAGERSQFTYAEGAFWGNLFGSNPYIYSCTRSALNTGSSTCTSAGCGLITPVGRCYNSDSAYKDQACFDRGGGSDWVAGCTNYMNKNYTLTDRVITTWLMP
jgi:hypothetical protein